ncbi:MAG: peptidylprolyl isomerase [Campylobacterales bacterium]|nr:peptidylprolyl isomerase [Campylobacterales bacterium]
MKKILIIASAVLLTNAAVFAKTYAKIGNEKITEKDIEIVLSANPNAPQIDQIPKDMIHKIVEQIVQRKVLSKHAIKSGIKSNPEYKKQLKGIEETLATNLWMKNELGKVKVTAKEIKKFYNDNIDKFSKQAQVKARHILVKTEKEAKSIIKTLKRTSSKKLEEKFISLAKEKSTGPSGKNGGDLGWFTKDKMVKPFADASFKMKSGQFTKKPVQTRFGYHVIYVEDKKREEKIPFETIAYKLEEAAKADKFKKQLDKKIGSLVKRSKVKYFTK